jgi:Spy/CpxP family protein refolding chaperone
MMVAAERAPWQNPRILSTLMLVFLAGAATGALVMKFGPRDLIRHSPVGLRPAPAHSADRDIVLQQFKTGLDLSDAQTQKLALLLDDYSQYYESVQEQLDDLRATGKKQFMAILNPEQRDKFEKMLPELVPQLAPK